MKSVKEEKALLRRVLREKARSFDPVYRRSADAAVRDLLFALPEYRNASRIFCFVSRPEEADTHLIIRAALSAGKTIAVPRCEGDGVMHACVIQDFYRDLVPGRYNIPEPAGTCPRLEPSALDLILVPCCSCSYDGKRLGFGGGFYDRYLEKTDAVTIALCRDELISDTVPTEPFDRKMDIVLTEAGIFRNPDTSRSLTTFL